MRVLLTGASGAIGRHAVPLLVGEGHDVTVAARRGSRRLPPVGPGVTVSPVDIFDRAAAGRVMRGHDAVINLATRVPTGAIRPFLPGAWAANDRIRREASRALAGAALDAGVPRLIQESFAPVYEDAGARWIDEGSAVRPAHYNRSVLDAERAVAEFGAGGGEAGVVLRFALFYGEDDPFTRTMLQAIRRGWLPLPGDPGAYLSMVHHEDAAAAVVAALGVPPGTYNVVDDEPLTRHDLGVDVARLLRVAEPRALPGWVTRVAGSLGDTISRSLRISNRKLRGATTWTPRHANVVAGLRGVVEAGRVVAPNDRS